MPYTDEAYFLTKIKQSELDLLIANDAGEPEPDRLTEAIASADSLINTYLKSVVTSLADFTAPRSIKQCSYYIASYYLYDNIAFNDVPERIEKNYKASIDYLKDIASGKVTIEDLPETNANTQVFYSVDTNRIDRNAF